MIEYYIEKIFMEKFGIPKANFRQPHWQVDSLAYSMLFDVILYEPKVPESLGMRLGAKA